MTSSKEKDRILAQIKAFKPHNEIEGLPKHIYELERNGFITVRYDTEKKPIIVRITTNGKTFLDSGGYTRLSKQQTKRSVRGLALRIVENVAVALISGYIGWVLRGCSEPMSDNPECADTICLKNDSTSLFSASLYGLNEDCVASRAKWSGVSLDSAKSTLVNDSIRMLEIDTSAKHSSVREESNAMPSGK